jgi:ArsR family transcriptional regulator
LASREEICACHLQGALELPQSTISRHLAILRDAGIVIGRRAQKWVYYRLVRPANGIHGALLEHMGPGADGDPVFESDRRRLDKLSPCKKTLPR